MSTATWSKTPPTAEEVNARRVPFKMAPYWWWRSEPLCPAHALFLRVSKDGKVSAVNSILELDWMPVDCMGGEWCCPAPTPDEVAARDAEIARLNAAIEAERGRQTQIATMLLLTGIIPRETESNVDGVEIVCKALKEARASLAAEKARGEAMGAAMRPFADLARGINATLPNDHAILFYGVHGLPLTAGHFRACQPNALDSAEAALKMAREIVSAGERDDGHAMVLELIPMLAEAIWALDAKEPS